MKPRELRKHLIEGGDIPEELVNEFEPRHYKNDRRARKSINKTLGSNFRAVFRLNREYRTSQWKANEIELDTGCVYVVTDDLRVLQFSNSEWFNISVVK